MALEFSIYVKINHSVEQCLTFELTANESQGKKGIKMTAVFSSFLLIIIDWGGIKQKSLNKLRFAILLNLLRSNKWKHSHIPNNKAKLQVPGDGISC